ncbi:SIMPL domain-containing protein [Chitinimonas sp. PSY-7]|uniref:SIMPL domain-containing protein n=1 Tax=Chitinimonas sp. PSY-7 TaxID=3459088 RepID=UPI0040403744
MNRIARVALVGLLATSALAEETIAYNIVSLQAEARREVQNDLAQASLYAEFSDPNAAQLSDKLNRALSDGLKVAKAYASVKAANGGNSVYPLYGKNNRAEGWRGRVEIRLESTDFKALAELVGKLQTNMQLGGMSFSVSPTALEKAETELIDEAVKAFRSRAEVVKRSVGGRGYKLVNMNVNTQGGGGYAPPPMMRAKVGMMRAEAMDAAPPPMEGGQSVVTVGVAGSIQIDRMD